MNDLRTSAGLLELMRQPGIGAGTAVALAQHFGSLEALVASSPADRRHAAGTRGGGLNVAAVSATRIRDSVDGVVGFFDPQFPPRLRMIPSPPAVLWVRGTLPDPTTAAVAIVGTRAPTSWGVRTAECAVEALAGTGAVIVSGLARGVDGVAHRRALGLGLKTCAILGSGVDAPTPREHAGLAGMILDAGGALISEVPPGTAPSARTLVARNRLQAGMSDAVVIAQCGIDSGTMHTARFALLQAKPLIVPEPIGDQVGLSENAGNLALIRHADPASVKASAADAKRLAGRTRFADFAPVDADQLRSAIREAVDFGSRAQVIDASASEQLKLES